MTHAAEETESKRKRRTDFKFWTLAGLVAAVLGFNVAERLVLDADETDISYARLIIPANRVIDPSPGDVFVFNHKHNAFVVSRFCALQVFGEAAEPTPATIRAWNLWGVSVNDTIASVGDYVGEKITNLARVENAERHWQISKHARQEVRAPMQENCLLAVVDAVKDPNLTPFIVDAVYRVEGADGTRDWVRFASPIILSSDACGGTCPASKSLTDIIKADPVTRFKSRLRIVQIQ